MRVIRNYLALATLVLWGSLCATCTDLNHHDDPAVSESFPNDEGDDSVLVDGMSFVACKYLLLRLKSANLLSDNNLCAICKKSSPCILFLMCVERKKSANIVVNELQLLVIHHRRRRLF